MQGWDPEQQARAERIQIVETRELPDRVQACVDHGRRIIWVAAGLSPTQGRCAVAYELGELHQGPTPKDPCLAAAHRRAAVDWAALMLVPTEDYVEAWAGGGGLAVMAGRCGVDVSTFRARMRAASNADQDAVVAVLEARRLSA